MQYLGGQTPILTKLALISKQKEDGTWKHRLIWDLLRSEVNDSVVCPERIVLPRIQDAVDDARSLLRGCADDPAIGLEWLVLDVADAFHNIPLKPQERRFACGKVGNRFIVFRVLCMGGKSAPTIWGRFAAAIGRVLASIANPDSFRVEVYVDDPLLTAAGSLRSRTFTFTKMLLALAVLGFPLAWSKASIGTSVVWIGAQLSVTDEGVRVSIPQGKLDTLRTETAQLRKTAVQPRRFVRSYCGKLSFVAGMVPILRPFLGMFWAALASKSSLPPALVHCRQFAVAARWMAALLHEVHGPLTREFPLHEPLAGDGTYIATDACPWGMAGVLFINNLPVAWYACQLDSRDLRRFRASRGDCRHNTTWEALALLIAIRIWLPGTTILARVKSDSLSALRSMVRLTSPSPALNLIARELALDRALGLYTIGVATHIPGASNKLPDDLSRMWAPEPHTLPIELANVQRVQEPIRDKHFWKTAQGPRKPGKRR